MAQKPNLSAKLSDTALKHLNLICTSLDISKTEAVEQSLTAFAKRFKKESIMKSEITIQIKENADPKQVMENFPYAKGQQISQILDDESDETQWILVDLAGKSDTNKEQEQHLNTDSRVLYYSIR